MSRQCLLWAIIFAVIAFIFVGVFIWGMVYTEDSLEASPFLYVVSKFRGVEVSRTPLPNFPPLLGVLAFALLFFFLSVSVYLKYRRIERDACAKKMQEMQGAA
jgi:hypothetical protein